MSDYGDLEIGLYRQEAGRYAVQLRFHRPDDPADRAPVQGAAEFDLAALRQLQDDPQAYGQRLADSLFCDPAVLGEFREACAAVEASITLRHLRLRLFVDRSAPELHDLRWETLCDPRDGSRLVTGDRLLFSRFLAGSDWRPIQLSLKGELRALVAIADPAALADDAHPWVVAGQRLAPVDVAGELARARQGLGSLCHDGDTLVTDPGAGTAVTLPSLVARLRAGYDILYLVCHGAFYPDAAPPGPYLFLDRDGGPFPTPGAELVDRLKDLDPGLRPRLIVLASCQSAGRGTDARTVDQGALAAIGPRLAQEAGIPAVVAMQGNVFMDTIARFMPVFFEQLRSHGQIDQAVAAARTTVLDRSDWWLPALFLRLRGGRLWYTPGFAADPDKPGFDRWPPLLDSIRNGKCTPILGPELLQPLYGSHRDIAHRWAESEGYPLAPHGQESLPQVAQYLATSPKRPRPRGKLLLDAYAELLRRHGDDVTDAQRAADLAPLSDAERARRLHEVIRAIGARRRARDPFDPYTVLARLPLALYITANPDDLLADALRETAIGPGQTKQPRVEVVRWKEELNLPSIYDAEPQYRPTPEQPLVYHLFGHLQDAESLVLTEDDHFDFLMWASRAEVLSPPQIPNAVTRAWTTHTLLFLGFRMEDWVFRVLFRSILNRDRRARKRQEGSVAVQVSPAEEVPAPARALRYLEDYFRLADIGIYWGTSADFVQELGQSWPGGSPGGVQP